MKYFQDPDTKNCYAIEEGHSTVVAPLKDTTNSKCYTVRMNVQDQEFLAVQFTEVDRDTVLTDHPRLLAYTEQTLEAGDPAGYGSVLLDEDGNL